MSIGIERIIEIMKEEKLFPDLGSEPKVLVVPIGKTLEKAIELTQKLRNSGIPADIDLMRRNVGKLMNYANSLGIPFVAVLGENEVKEKKVTLKDMKSGKQEAIDEKILIKKLSPQ